MRALKMVLLSISFILLALLFLIQSTTALSKISSYLSKNVSKELGYPMQLEVKDLSLSLNGLETHIMINSLLNLELNASLFSFEEGYDTSYHIVGDRVSFSTIDFEDSINIRGIFKGTEDDFILKGDGDALEGTVDFSLHHQQKEEKDIYLHTEHINASKLLKILGEKPLLDAKISLDAKIERYSRFSKSGDISLVIDSARFNQKILKERFDFLIPADLLFRGDARLHLNDALHSFDAKIASDIATITFKNGKILDQTKKITADYSLNVPELSKLRFMTHDGYHGEFIAKGEVEYLDKLRLDGDSKSFGGLVEFYFDEKLLEAKLDGVSLESIYRLIDYPSIMIGDISGKIERYMVTRVASINLRSKNLSFENNHLLELIYEKSSIDIAKELFTHAYLTASVENGIVFYDFKAENTTSHIALIDARIDTHKNTIDSKFDITMQEEELSGELYGPLSSPKIDLDMAKYLQFKVKKEIDNLSVDDVKGFIKGFF